MKPVQKIILYVEDDIDDRDLFFDVLRTTHPELEVVTAANGKEAMDYLHIAKTKDGLPSLIILDINMPVMDGKEVLSVIHTDPSLHQVPVVVFTSSENPEDRDYVSNYGITLLNKPYELVRMPALVERMLAYSA